MTPLSRKLCSLRLCHNAKTRLFSDIFHRVCPEPALVSQVIVFHEGKRAFSPETAPSRAEHLGPGGLRYRPESTGLRWDGCGPTLS